MSDADEPRDYGPPKTLIREVSANSIIDAAVHCLEYGKDYYDMYIIDYQPDLDREGRVKVFIFGWENKESRQYLAV